MKPPGSLRLLLLGAAPRLIGALILSALLWLGFFWATGSFNTSF